MLGKKGRAFTGVMWTIVSVFHMSCHNTTHANDLVRKNKTLKTAVDYLSNWQPLPYDATKKYIYLTFDDGPQPGTVACYNLLKQEGIKGSFFMVGYHTDKKTDGHKIVSMIRNGYPQVLLANHSYSHAMGDYKDFYKHAAVTERDFERAQHMLQVPYRIARLPGNSGWVLNGKVKTCGLVRPVAKLLDSAGYNVVGWEVEWRFNHKTERPVQTPQQLANEVDSAFGNHHTHTRNHLVILSHDRMFRQLSDADSLAKFIRILKQNPAYVFETIDHYPGLKKPVYKH